MNLGSKIFPKEKTCLVTGGAHRLGAAIAIACAEAGMNLVIHYNSSENDARKTAQKAIAIGVNTSILKADLSSSEECGSLIEKAREAAGPIHYLVNSAAEFKPSMLSSAPLPELEKIMRLNAWAPLLLIRSFAAQQEALAAVNILDSRILRYDMNHAGYQLSKNLLYHITEMAAAEYAPKLRVNAVAPGPVIPHAGADHSSVERLIKTTLLKRLAAPQDTAAAVVFLLTNNSMTGQTVTVDCGNKLKGGILPEKTPTLFCKPMPPRG